MDGTEAETLACAHLQRRGLKLLARNYRTPRGEIDLIMRDGDHLVFVEVRYRRDARFGGAAASVDARKQAKLIACALHYLQNTPGADRRPARFDVVGITPAAPQARIDWLRDAFQVE